MLTPPVLTVCIVQMRKLGLSQAEWQQVCVTPKPVLMAWPKRCAAESPSSGVHCCLGQQTECCWDVHGPVFLPTLPVAFPAAPVPGAHRHVCHSIILSGLPGSHYFTAAIIYSSTSPQPVDGHLP